MRASRMKESQYSPKFPQKLLHEVIEVDKGAGRIRQGDNSNRARDIKVPNRHKVKLLNLAQPLIRRDEDELAHMQGPLSITKALLLYELRLGNYLANNEPKIEEKNQIMEMCNLRPKVKSCDLRQNKDDFNR